MKYVEVVVLQSHKMTDSFFTYGLETHHVEMASVGSRVVVPFGGGNRFLLGVIVSIKEEVEESTPYKIKSIFDVLPEIYSLSRDQVALALYMKSEYLSTYAEAFQCVSPSGVEIVTKTVYLLAEGVSETVIQQGTFKNGELINVKAVPAPLLEKAVKKKQIIKHTQFIPSFSLQTTCFVHTTGVDLASGLEKLPKKATKLKTLLTYLWDNHPMTLPQIRSAMNVTTRDIDRLQDLDLIRYEEILENRTPQIFTSLRPRGDIVLTEAQRYIFTVLKEALASDDTQRPFLLKGVTGSGKTEIYIELAKFAAVNNHQVLVLVPEIALTPQLTDKFNRAFSGQVAILHSLIPSKERMEQWQRIKRGEIKVVIGARSAVFAPFTSLKVVVMDEEHDDSYKSDTAPRYDTKDLVRWLAEKNKALVLLASGTPAIESLYRAQEGQYHYLELNKRYNDYAFPTVQIVDMKREIKRGHKGFLSQQMIDGIMSTVNKGQQGLLFLNRKGHSTQVICQSCGERVKCPNCDISLTYYKKNNMSLCHYCGYTKNSLNSCESCQGTVFDFLGVGVEKVEEELHVLLPQLRIAKVDSGVTAKKGALEAIYHDFEAHKLDLILGTQIITKGVDFNRVSFIGVLGVDALLSMPDYRANERAFNLLTQLAGRGGRGDMDSLFMIQTYMPEHPILQAVSRYDHSGYMTDEMVLRYIFKYPPYYEMAQLVVSSEDPLQAEKSAKQLHLKLKKSFEKYKIYVELSGPNPALYARIKNRYRMQLILKFNLSEKERVKRVLQYYLQDEYHRFFESEVRVTVDLKPLSLH